jgi:putative hemolysin
VREGVAGGAIEPQERAMIERVISLGDRSIRQVMTPRHSVQALDASARLDLVVDTMLESGFSRFPVYEGHIDQVIGIAHVRDLMTVHRREPSAPVRDAMRAPLFVPEGSRAAILLTTFRKQQQHMAVVIGEHGTVEGVVTLEDVLEEIVGEIADEYDEAEQELIVRREDGSLLIEGLAPIDRVMRTLHLSELPADERYRFETMAGLVLSLLGHIPRTGESVTWESWRFEVIDMDGLRIDKVLATQIAER